VSDALELGRRGPGPWGTWRPTTTPPPLRPYARAYAYRGLRALASLSMARSGSHASLVLANVATPTQPSASLSVAAMAIMITSISL
jgi:hypothetical protein